MTFQDQAGNSIQLPFPHKGINLTSNNDPSSARYLQNVLLGNNNTGKIRYGTNLESSFEFDEDVIHRSIIHGASFLKCIRGKTKAYSPRAQDFVLEDFNGRWAWMRSLCSQIIGMTPPS